MSQIRTNPLPGAPRRSYRPAVLVVLGLVAIGTSACSTKRVERIDPTAVTDLSGRWNDTDSRLVANELIEQSLSASWARNYSVARGGEAPPVIVGEFRNRTMEHIPVNTFHPGPRASVRKLGNGTGRRQLGSAGGDPHGTRGPTGARECFDAGALGPGARGKVRASG